MSFQAIVKAIANLEAALIPLSNQFIALNQMKTFSRTSYLN